MNTEIKVHELKTWPEYFQEVKNGNKNFEFRDNDRDFKVGDTVILKEWKPNEWTPHVGNYTGDEITMRISYVLTEGFGLPFGKAIISLLPESVATPEAEYRVKDENNAREQNERMRNWFSEITGLKGDWLLSDQMKAVKRMLAAIKKDEPDLVASDNNTNQASLASHSYTEGNSIELEDLKDMADKYYKKLTEKSPIKGIGSQEYNYFIYGLEFTFNRLQSLLNTNHQQYG